jgi:hypothetical protein
VVGFLCFTTMGYTGPFITMFVWTVSFAFIKPAVMVCVQSSQSILVLLQLSGCIHACRSTANCIIIDHFSAFEPGLVAPFLYAA